MKNAPTAAELENAQRLEEACLKVCCPSCRRGIGEQCITSTGKRTAAHGARFDLASRCNLIPVR